MKKPIIHEKAKGEGREREKGSSFHCLLVADKDQRISSGLARTAQTFGEWGRESERDDHAAGTERDGSKRAASIS